MAAILGKFTVLFLSSSFVVYFIKSKLILFYYSVAYYHTRIFLISLPHAVHMQDIVSNETIEIIFFSGSSIIWMIGVFYVMSSFIMLSIAKNRIFR